MKAWRCSVCGHIHRGDIPPKKCPVCGADREKFLPITEADDNKEPIVLPRDYQSKEITVDVLVVGSGAAAFSAAITARSQGLSVIMLEKAKEIGGTTARSGGGAWIPNNPHQKEIGITDDRDAAIQYMARYSYPHLYNPASKTLGLPEHQYSLICAYYDNGYHMVEHLNAIGALTTMVEINWTGQGQVDYQDHLPENRGIRGRSIYPKQEDGTLGYGGVLIGQLEAWAIAHDIQILVNHQATGILTNEKGEVIGLDVLADGYPAVFWAKKGVIFGSGGYSHNPDYMLQFQRGPHFGGCSVPTNTGDFITLAGAIGAKIGNTAGAFRAQCMVEQALKEPGGSSNVFYLAGDSIILVNKYGHRVVDEKRNYTDRTMSHFVWDAQKAEWQNMLQFLLFDERSATMWQGFPPFPLQGQELPPYLIKADTLEEVEAEIQKRLLTIAPHTGGFQLEPTFLSGLKATISRFNGFSKTGVDEDFHRGDFTYDREWTTFPPTVPGIAWPAEGAKNYTMHPISDEGPYYALILGAGTLDTNGGPVINARAQVLDYGMEPIHGLYGAGNCIASPTANAYWGGGSTIGPGMTFGYIAGLHVASLPDKQR
ncbi:FAD-dependent oxidoreductase [Eubacteriales bacterium OttesenSCG-928-M02]|nr:FAD-dependent oxidoreductase [Eubacteriales bacterium OttesenSCG-928-M02]